MIAEQATIILAKCKIEEFICREKKMGLNKPTYDAFISYSSEEGLFAKSLANALRNQGLSVWYDEGKL